MAPRILCTSLAGTGSDDRDRLKPDCDGRPCGGTSNEGVTPDDTGGSRVVGSSEVVPDEPDGPDTTREGDAPVKIGTADTEEAGGRTPRAKGTPDEPATEEGAGAVEDTGRGGIGGTEGTSVEDVEGGSEAGVRLAS